MRHLPGAPKIHTRGRNRGKMADNRGENIRSGELLIVQGSEPKYIYYLQSGAVEILSAPDEFNELHPDILVSRSKRVGVIREKGVISGMSLLFNEPYKKSIRVIEDSVVAKHPIREGGIMQVLKENPQMAMSLFTHMTRRIKLSIADAGKYARLYQNLALVNDNLGLVYRKNAVGDAPDRLQQRADALYATYVKNGGDFPSVIDAKFLIRDNSSLLKKKYAYQGLPLESLVDMRQCTFLTQISNLDPGLLQPIINSDPAIPSYIFETVAENLIKVLDRIEAIHNEIDEELSQLFGSEASWVTFLVDGGELTAWQKRGRISEDFVKNFLSVAVKFHNFFEEISGKKLTVEYPAFRKLHEYYSGRKDLPAAAPAQNETRRQETAASPGRSRATGTLYQNSMQQIFEFAVVEKEFQKSLLMALTEFKKSSNPFNTEIEGRKIRRAITKMYFDLYKQVFIRTKKESSAPAPVKLMLNFGFLDEAMLEEGQISELHSLTLRAHEITELPIYFEEDFLTLIYEGKENPSINEMGMTYEAHLREEEKHRKAKDDGAASIDENLKRVMYEIDHRLLNTLAVCSGSTATAFPILTNMTMKGNPANFYTSKKKLESIAQGLKEIDYSVFYREIIEKVGEAREIIEEEVLPSFVLIPSFGTKSMLWQELDGTNRKSRGRIVVPILFMGDLQKNLAHTFACFRWELNRTLKGAMWADPVEGGLTGVYFDYVNFFKKMSKLSVETKSYIEERFKSIRTNRDRFADDYIMWLLYEREGIMKCNSVVREMMYRYVPFRKDVRNRLENMPAFAEIGTKFKNIRTREITGYQRKFKKYMDGEGRLPEALQRFLDFMQN
ncbi:MAG: cyclic nucleotide-binding domain-containing protein [Spirochaetes bacterium]|nr:MAG: cyclic nucleotide-binding domain-containing protein [Spirochaetota bacterium]